MLESWLRVVLAVQGGCWKVSPKFLYIAIVTSEVFPGTHASIHASGVSTMYEAKGVKQYLRFPSGSDIIHPMHAACLSGSSRISRHWWTKWASRTLCIRFTRCKNSAMGSSTVRRKACEDALFRVTILILLIRSG
jgi:hypothetical protein